MQEQISSVEAFMNLFGQEVKQKIEWPKPATADLRVSLLEEEVKELREAVEQRDLVGVLDALTDIRYVLDGAIIAFGMQKIAPTAFEEVHFANMEKACTDKDMADRTVEKYKAEGVETYIQQKGEYWLVKRKGDDKVLKSVDWREQDLPGLLSAHLSGQG